MSLLKNDRGLAGILVVLIMIILVLVAIGIIWTTIKGTLESGTEQIEFSSKCLLIDIKSTKLECSGANNDVCNVTISRNARGDDIAGVKLVFTNSIGETNYIYDIPGNVPPLGIKTEQNIATGIVDTSNVKVVSYFLDSSGEEQICTVI